jgi:peptidyl-prolyl cis-trans isomerase D
MLRYLRENVGNWIIKIFLGIIVLVFIFFGFGTFGTKKADSVATVNGEPISFKEYQQSYQNMINLYRSMFGQNLNDKVLKALNIKQQALDELITRKIVTLEAEKFNIKVSDKEIQDSIMTIQAFQSNGAFDMEKYMAILNRQSLTPEDFESLQRVVIQQEKFRSMIQSTINISDIEAGEWYQFQNTKVSVKYIKFDPASYKNIKPEKAQIQQYYNENKDKYTTLPQRKALYIKISPGDFRDTVKLTEENIKDYYEQNIEDFKIPETAKNADKTKVKPLSEVSEQIKQELEKREMADAAYLKAFDAFDAVLDGDDFEQVALLAGTKIIETGLFNPDGKGLKIEEKLEFANIAFALALDSISDVKEIGESYYIIKLAEVVEPVVQELAQAKDRVTQDIIKELQTTKAKEDAQHYLDMIIKAGKPEKIAKANKLKIKTTPLFARNGTIKGIKNPSKLIKAGFTLTKDRSIYKEVVETDSGFFLITLKERQAADQTKIAENLKETKRLLSFRKQSLYFEEWISELKKQYEIEYNEQLLN